MRLPLTIGTRCLLALLLAFPGARAIAQNDAAAANNFPALNSFQGKTVISISFTGVDQSALESVRPDLPQQPGQPYDAEKVRQTLRQLYATGLYDQIEVLGGPGGNGVALIFSGVARAFFGNIVVAGVKSDRLASQLQRSTGIEIGAAYSQDAVNKGQIAILQSLDRNGYHEGKASASAQKNSATGLMTVTYSVDTGPQARVGAVTSRGETSITEKELRKVSKLKLNKKVTPDTTRTAINGLRKHYQKQDRLEAKVTLETEQFQPLTNHEDFGFLIDGGPVVRFVVDGANVSRHKLESLVPVFQEGSVDEDLLNEGSRHLRDYFQEHGYFDARISHEEHALANGILQITYAVNKGRLHKVASVDITGNKYFSEDTLRERLAVEKADVLLRYGRYTEALLSHDVDAIQAVYLSNGFRDVKVTPEVKDQDKTSALTGKQVSIIRITYKVEEGPQSKFGAVDINGASKVPETALRKLMNSQPGQPYSLTNLAGDRDAMLNYYLSKGFANANVALTQTPEKNGPRTINVTFAVTEGEQAFVNNIFITGLHYTRQSVVDQLLDVHKGDPLDRSALIETQRRLYDLALFNEVDTAVENPTGQLPRKNVLINLQEAKRWDFTYGFGIQAQTGNPNTGCPSVATLIQLGIDPATYHCSPSGYSGASGLIAFDLTRINLRGRDQSITLHTQYGTLEQAETLTFTDSHFRGNPNLTFSISGGYINNQDVTTFASSRLEGNVQLQQVLDRTANRRPLDTFIYRFSYRRVQVNPATIQVAADEIPLLSEPARVGGPGFTYIRDRRDDPLNAHRGNYLTAQIFASSSLFASQADFLRFDVTQASYHPFGKRQWVLARSTRYGAEATYGGLSLRTVPLPERLFAGGSNSHRGFAINQAGPRDTQTGYPLGGGGAFVNSTELRTPPAQLPLVGNNLSFVLFWDFGNVFADPGEVVSSFFQWKQPNTSTCRNLATDGGLCNFNYMSHALGLGFRYATPIGPVRVDLSENLNPPVYPILIDPVNGPHVGQLNHFNFFFSLGQSF